MKRYSVRVSAQGFGTFANLEVEVDYDYENEIVSTFMERVVREVSCQGYTPLRYISINSIEDAACVCVCESVELLSKRVFSAIDRITFLRDVQDNIEQFIEKGWTVESAKFKEMACRSFIEGVCITLNALGYDASGKGRVLSAMNNLGFNAVAF